MDKHPVCGRSLRTVACAGVGIVEVRHISDIEHHGAAAFFERYFDVSFRVYRLNLGPVTRNDGFVLPAFPKNDVVALRHIPEFAAGIFSRRNVPSGYK